MDHLSLVCVRRRCHEEASRTQLGDGSSHRMLRLGAQRKAELLSTLARDCAWLEAHGRTDYSLLVAVGPGYGEAKNLSRSSLFALMNHGYMFALLEQVSKNRWRHPSSQTFGHRLRMDSHPTETKKMLEFTAV